ncbi:hydantoinase/oxoprolinase family protein [Candidatus Nephthysia bennettiae]|uniref:Hydantoinase/oxoprolinase family protein n=1 Tax=Candidatus Nephthysia bennettiae TaxID=3127016 RepID=A0A934KE59_9BACT|nr:hydantoinase/oxoprolinase family protein [Candidatus Dormibacteraeota bacterium]
MRVATDVGGTFTDLVYYDQGTGRFGATKSDTTPPNLERGVLDTIEKAGLDASTVEYFAHGSTVVINALTERKGVKTGLITTKGFRDVLEIGRGNRPDLFNFYFRKPKPFVPRHLRTGVTERIDHRGRELMPLKVEDLESAVDQLRDAGVEAVAICFLHAYANPVHEEQAVEIVRRRWPQAAVLASHQITREWREYERTSTTVLSAYIHPIANGYLDALERELRAKGVGSPLYIMQSNGGVATMKAARANPIAAVESGPVSGVLGAIVLGGIIGESNIITLDIGGTTAKCSLVEAGRPRVTTEYRIEWTRTNPGYPIKTPVIDIVEIGNGGGSIAWLDEAGSLHVGPQSAGAVPGPAAYGRGGTQPTTTDANLVTGRIDPEYFLGGEIVPDMDNVRTALKALADRMERPIEDLARGIIRIANANMGNALKLVSLNRGYDPREFTLVAFGGGGAMHATALAQDLGITKVIVPTNPAVFSAWGMLLTDLRRDYLRTRVTRLDDTDPAEVVRHYAELERAARDEFGVDGIDADRLVFERYADMRYVGQEHTVKVRLPNSDGLDSVEVGTQRFHDAHQREYSYRLDSAIELVNYHLAALGLVSKPELIPLGRTGKGVETAIRGRRSVDFDAGGVHMTTIYERAGLEPEMTLQGPAIVEEPATTIVVLPEQQLRVDEYGNLHIELDQR